MPFFLAGVIIRVTALGTLQSFELGVWGCPQGVNRVTRNPWLPLETGEIRCRRRRRAPKN